MSNQTAKLIARIAEQLPDLPKDVAQGWIDNPKALKKVLASALCPPALPWTVDDEGNIRFTLTSNGLTSEEWGQHLDRRGWRIGDDERQVLRRASEAPTICVTYNIVVCPGKKISGSDRTTGKIRAAANEKGWLKPHWEVACLIRDTFTDEQLKQMGLRYIMTMHQPIKDSDGVPRLFNSDRRGGNFFAGRDGPVHDLLTLLDDGGFAFVVTQANIQT